MRHGPSESRAFSIHDHFDLSPPANLAARGHEVEREAVADAVLVRGASSRSIPAFSESGLREFLRLALKRVRSEAELRSLLDRHGSWECYLPPRRRSGAFPTREARAGLPG